MSDPLAVNGSDPATADRATRDDNTPVPNSHAIHAAPGPGSGSGAPRAGLEALPIGSVKVPEPGKQILLADLDGDGRDDPVVVYGNKTGCLLGRPVRSGSSFSFETLPVAGGARVFAPLLGDADGDGTIDLLSADADGVVLWKGSGRGSFAAAPRRLVEAADLLFPTEGCAATSPYLLDENGDGTVELVLPILGGVRLVPLGASPSVGEEGPGLELLTEPRIGGGKGGLTFVSPVPTYIGSGASRIALLGPVLERASPRLDLTWWRAGAGGPVEPHRSSLVLPPGQNAALVHPFDLEGDGRPEIAVVTTPTRVTKLLGEFGLLVYRVSDRADTPVQPFFSGATNINYWQFPVLTARPAAGGSDLLLAFYRGLTTAHLNVEIFRWDGAGSFDPKPHDVELVSDKKADREFLIWADVDGDGIEDLVAADEAELQVHRGAGVREQPIARDKSWTCPIVPAKGNVSLSLGGSGTFAIRLAPSAGRVLSDLDGDGLAEAIFIKNGSGGVSEVVLGKLKPPAK